MKRPYSSHSLCSEPAYHLSRRSSLIVSVTATFVAVITLLVLSANRGLAGADAQSAVVVVMDVPHPGWKVQIESMHIKAGKLLVVCRASSSEGMHAAMISKAGDSKMLDKKLAALPREIYLLDRGWRWGKGYKAVTPVELKKILEGSKLVYPQQDDKGGSKDEKPKADDGAEVQADGELDINRLVGMPVELAQALAKKHKLPSRVVTVDGKPRMVTSDFRPERLNFTVVKGKVTRVTKG